MGTLLQRVDTLPSGGESRLADLRDFDFLQWGRRSRFTGIVLGDEVLVIDYKLFVSFRINRANLFALRQAIRCYRCAKDKLPFERAYIDRYFAENHDNPYGVWSVILSAMNDRIPREFTQFPPLLVPKTVNSQRDAIGRIRELALPNDAFFTFDRASRFSRLIRRWDKGMWSHCGTIGRNNTLYEMLTSGAVKSDFSRLESPTLDVGLYREHTPRSEEQLDGIFTFWEGLVAAKAPYGWRRLMRLALRRRFGIDVNRQRDDITPAELIYANILKLICFA